MEINILAFGQVAEVIGKMQMRISYVDNTSDLNRKLSEEFPLLLSVEYVLAVNKNVINENTKLNPEDTVALLPPFSGG